MLGPRGLCIEADELIGMSYRLIRTPYLSLHEIISRLLVMNGCKKLRRFFFFGYQVVSWVEVVDLWL